MLKLAPTDEQHRALLEMMKGFKEAANWIAKAAVEHRTASKYRLSFIEYKAVIAGVVVCLVDPSSTPKSCSLCGRCKRVNRKSEAKFICKYCGHAAPADVNAAVNIAARAEVVRRPIVSLRAS